MNWKFNGIDPTTLLTIIALVTMFGLLLVYPRGQLPSNIIVPFEPTQATTTTILESKPSADMGAFALQSIAFGAADFTGDLITFTPGPSTITQIWMGFPIYMWVILGGVVLVNIVLTFYKPKFVNVERDTAITNLINLTYIPIIVISGLWLGQMLTSQQTGYPLFYVLLYVLFIVPIVLVKFLTKWDINICINDRILGGFIDTTFFNQFVMILFAVPIIFGLLSIGQFNYSAFAISGSKISALAVIQPEDSALQYIPSMLFILIGCTFLLLFIAFTYNMDTYKVTHFDFDYMLEVINFHPRAFFSGFVVMLVLTATISGYVGESYHKNVYKNTAKIIALQQGITEEQAYLIISRSVSDFWTWGAMANVLCGSVLPSNFVHMVVNYNAS